MKTAVIIFLLSLLVSCSVDNSISEESQISKSINKLNTGHVFEPVEQLPCFPGGQQALLTYIDQNIRYPKELEESCVQGRVVVKFLIGSDGSISQACVIKSLEPELDKDAIRVVMSMPKWTPGKNKGVPVDCWYYLPVKYMLK